MSDPISPTGSPGQVPPVAAPSPSLTEFNRPGASVGFSAVASAIGSTPAKASAEASVTAKLELSNAASAGMKPAQAAPQSMNVAEAAQAFQEYLKNLPSDLQFEPDAESGIVVFKVINPITQKVIRQYPPEEMLALARNIRQSLKAEAPGILFDSKH